MIKYVDSIAVVGSFMLALFTVYSVWLPYKYRRELAQERFSLEVFRADYRPSMLMGALIFALFIVVGVY